MVELKFEIKDHQKISFFSFSKNEQFHTSLFSAANQATSSQLKIYDQKKVLLGEIDAGNLFLSYLESFLFHLTVDLFSGDPGNPEKIFDSLENEKLYFVYEKMQEKLKWQQDLFSFQVPKFSNKDQYFDAFNAHFLTLHEQEKEFRLLSFADIPNLHKKIYLMMAGMIDVYLQNLSSNPEVHPLLLQNLRFDNYKKLPDRNLRAITFCAATKNYILVEEKYQEFVKNMECKMLDRLYEWYF